MRTTKKLIAVSIGICLAFLLLAGCAPKAENVSTNPSSQPAQEWTPSAERVSFEGLSYQPWDVESLAAETGEKVQKEYTIMIYLNGSDLESGNGLATGDLQEIIGSKFDSDKINVLILTGGTAQWHNEIVPNETCAIYEVVNDDLVLIGEIGQLNMGDAGTLSGFIDFGMRSFPANKYGLVLWNHGGGTIAGFGVDENFGYDSLDLLELNYALEKSQAADVNFEFIGFDACLMATVETAVILQDYARYMIASEELEPGEGWDYAWLTDLSQNPQMSGSDLGKVITDKFIDFYSSRGDDVTLSVIDLAKSDEVLNAMGKLMAASNQDFSRETFKEFAKSRNITKQFGGGSPRDNQFDMVDIGDMALKLDQNYPEEAKALFQAVDDAVIYNRNSANVQGAYGLSTYYIFTGKEQAQYSIEMYESLVMNPHYTQFLMNFASELTGESFAEIDLSGQMPEQNDAGDFVIWLTPEEMDNLLEIYFTVWEPVPYEDDYYFMLGLSSEVDISEDGMILTEFDGIWPGINGQFVSLYEINATEKYSKYAIPAVLNGEDVDLIVIYDDENPDGKILGARPLTDENIDMAAKNLIKIKRGDKVKLLYYAEYFGDDPSKEVEQWYESDEFVAEDEIQIEILEVNAGERYLYGFLLKDIQQNEYYTDFIEVEFLD